MVTAAYEHQRKDRLRSLRCISNLIMQDFTCFDPIKRLETLLCSAHMEQNEMGLDGLYILDV